MIFITNLRIIVDRRISIYITYQFLDPSGKGVYMIRRSVVLFVCLFVCLSDCLVSANRSLMFTDGLSSNFSQMLASIPTTVLPENQIDWGIVAHSMSFFFFFFFFFFSSTHILTNFGAARGVSRPSS